MKLSNTHSFLGRLAGLHRWVFASLALLLTVCLASAALGADNLYTGAGTDPQDWFDPNNWSLDQVPASSGDPNYEGTKIYESFTSEISSGAADYGDKDLSIGDSDIGETATLIISGGSLNGTGSGNDIRLGVGDDQSGSLGRIIQTNGDVTAVDYIKMSNAGEQAAAGSHYQISGGSLTIVDQLEMGRDDGVVQNMIKFEVIGTGPTSITADDVKVNRVHALSPAHPTFSFTIDGTATGVTPIVVADELQLGNSETSDDEVGKLFLELNLSDVPTNNEIILFKAGRITMDEQFHNLPDGSRVSAPYAGNLYDWRINYFDGTESDNKAVSLDDLRVLPIPEPASLALFALAAAPLALRRRRVC